MHQGTLEVEQAIDFRPLPTVQKSCAIDEHMGPVVPGLFGNLVLEQAERISLGFLQGTVSPTCSICLDFHPS